MNPKAKLNFTKKVLTLSFLFFTNDIFRKFRNLSNTTSAVLDKVTAFIGSCATNGAILSIQ